MTTEETTLLNTLLIKFFEESKFGSPNYLARNSTASLLKKHLLNIGHWKNKPRNKSPKLNDKMFVKKFLEKHKDCPF
jgi:hypothetical protein